MVFDRQRTEKLARRRDRDYAPFFAGREAEIARFRQALDESADPDYEAASFRVYQGAPGVGKTSLLNRLRASYAAEALFVPIRTKDLTSFDALGTAVRNGLIDGANAGFRFGTKAAAEILRRFKLSGFVNSGEKVLAEQTGARNRLVLYMDEAQSVTPGCASGLLELHTHGTGSPTVVLLVGLSNTWDRLTDAGLSRLAGNAVVNMGAMTAGECAESTAKMLKAVGAEGDREHAARVAAEVSFGWPRYLTGARQALCRELLRTNGDLDRTDFARVRDQTEKSRHVYYRERLGNTVLGQHLFFTAAVVADVQRFGPMDPGDLVGVCGKRLAADRDRLPGLAGTTGQEFADVLVERGVFAFRDDGRCEVAIPSMADWLAATTLARRTGRGGIAR